MRSCCVTGVSDLEVCGELVLEGECGRHGPVVVGQEEHVYVVPPVQTAVILAVDLL